MAIATKVETDCLMLGEFVDQAEVPSGVTFHEGVPDLPSSITEFVDNWSVGDGTKEFTVLLHDGRVVAVRGHGLKHMPAGAAGEPDTYGIVVRAAEREELVGLFRTSEVN